MMCSIKLFISIIITCFLITGGNALGGILFQWTDGDGVVHFSDRLPKNIEQPEDSLKARDLADIQPTRKKRPPAAIPPKNPIQNAINGTFTIKGERNLGTAFFISSTGYAVTCKHVLEEANGHIAVLNDKTEHPIGVIAKSDRYDLALILVLSSTINTPLNIRDPFSLAPGERVYAIGSSIVLQSTVTDGIFKGIRERLDTGDLGIQFSAPINPGNSGGPLIDDKGRVIGVISWKIESKKGIPVTGVGFAVPSTYVMEEFGTYME
ncbi:trypsin-like peptidase domain-containing protein [Thermodesulfobacteriota bacterium]